MTSIRIKLVEGIQLYYLWNSIPLPLWAYFGSSLFAQKLEVNSKITTKLMGIVFLRTPGRLLFTSPKYDNYLIRTNMKITSHITPWKSREIWSRYSFLLCHKYHVILETKSTHIMIQLYWTGSMVCEGSRKIICSSSCSLTRKVVIEKW